MAQPASAQHVRRLAERSQSAVVALDHRVGMGGGFLNNQRNSGENLFDSQARTTGFVISKQGHVVTHARYVQGRDRIRLYFHGGAKGWAKVLGVDPVNRTALLQLEKPKAIADRFGGNLPTLEWGDSTGLAPGNTVFSLGNCFDSLRLDSQASFSQGVITTIERARLGAYRGPLIETDASVNPGSFGGPLLNIKGQVVGVIARNISTRRWLGAAIPAEQVRRGVERMMAGRPLAKGLLGLALERTGGETALRGLKVTRVQGESGAAKAGLSVGDFLLAIDGNRVYDTHDVARELGTLPSGAVVNARVRRGATTRTIQIVLGDGADLAIAAARPKPTPEPVPTPEAAPKARVSLGLRVQEREAGPGLEVTEVRPGGTAAAAGVQKGDILAALGRDRIRTSEDLARALAKYSKGQRVQLVIIRERRARRLLLHFGGATATKPKPQPRPTRPTPTPVRRGTLGVRVQERSDGSPGLEVLEVRPETAAADGGVRTGDVILRWNQFQIRTMDDLGRALANLKDGGPTRMRVLRSGRQLALRLPAIGKAPTTTPTPTGRPRLGLRLDEVAGKRGPVVIEVAPGSLAAKAGFQKDDVLVALGRKRVNTLDEVAAVLSGLRPGSRVVAVVIRDSRARRLGFVWGPGGQPAPKPAPPVRAAPGYLGVYLPDDQGTGPGVLIEGSVVGSPADQAGLRSGDRIVSINGRSVNSRQELGQALRGKRAGEPLALMISREGKTLGVSLILGERGKTAPPQPKQRPTPSPSAGGAWLGASIQDGPDGVTVAEVARGGPLATAGLRSGDVLLAIEGQRLTTVDQFASLFARLRPGQTVKLQVERDGWSKTVEVRLGRRP